MILLLHYFTYKLLTQYNNDSVYHHEKHFVDVLINNQSVQIDNGKH